MQRGIGRPLGFAGVVVALGIAFGDIGTSPLYVMHVLVHIGGRLDFDYVAGVVSCVIWTLTLLTTVKYAWIALGADNHGEGGILSLYALQRVRRAGPDASKPETPGTNGVRQRRWRRGTWLCAFAVIGAGALVADGVITPAITVTSAIEGLEMYTPDIAVVPVTMAVLTVLFLFQRFGTQSIGRFFGPVMVVWFVTLGTLGAMQIAHGPAILAALNPLCGVRLLYENPVGGLMILGVVFLCTTGAEALYADLGHCGAGNLRVAWGVAKICLILNYLGQGAWILAQPAADHAALGNPFFRIIPAPLLLPGVLLATAAAVIASQSLISGLFTLFHEAMSLDLWPRMAVKYPSDARGQVYVPMVNRFLCVACLTVVFVLRSSTNMEGAYGLSITVTMLTTSLLLIGWLGRSRKHPYLAALFGVVFLSVELLFLAANSLKFLHGGAITILLGGSVAAMMLIWRRGESIRDRFRDFVDVREPVRDGLLQELRADTTIPMSACNLVFLTKSPSAGRIEGRIVWSVLFRSPKRADHYWTIHVDFTDEPHTRSGFIEELVPGEVFRAVFQLGYRVRPAIHAMFHEMVEEMEREGRIDLTSSHPSLRARSLRGNFRWIVVRRVINDWSIFTPTERRILILHEQLRRLKISEVEAFGLDTCDVEQETAPLMFEYPVPPHPVPAPSTPR